MKKFLRIFALTLILFIKPSSSIASEEPFSNPQQIIIFSLNNWLMPSAGPLNRCEFWVGLSFLHGGYVVVDDKNTIEKIMTSINNAVLLRHLEYNCYESSFSVNRTTYCIEVRPQSYPIYSIILQFSDNSFELIWIDYFYKQRRMEWLDKEYITPQYLIDFLDKIPRERWKNVPWKCQ